MSYHVLLDSYEEERLAGAAFGSTKSGIAPFYSDKYAKIGIQVADLYNEERLMGQLEHICTLKNVLLEHLYHKPLLEPKALFDELMGYRAALEPYVGDAVGFVHRALKEGRRVLLEGQLGSMKDPNLGICPMTTSSHTLAGFGTVGGAVPPTALTDIITVTKAYSSAVGRRLRQRAVRRGGRRTERRGGDAGEFGATTGRPRRVGWFDAVATKYGCMVQGPHRWRSPPLTAWATSTRSRCAPAMRIDGKVTTDFPVPALLDRAKPVYETLPGWKCDIRGVTDYGKLPQAARDYVDFIEKHIEAPITIVSTGPKRHEICRRAGS